MAPATTARPAGASFEAIFRDTYPRVVALVTATIGDASAAEQAVQEAYGLALVRWSVVGRMGRPDLWVSRVAMRIAIDTWRRQPAPTQDEGEASRAIPNDVQRLWARWRLEGLAPPQRATILLRQLEGPRALEATPGEERAPSARAHQRGARQRFRVLIGRRDRSRG